MSKSPSDLLKAAFGQDYDPATSNRRLQWPKHEK
jgi:hypothetical protein